MLRFAFIIAAVLLAAPAWTAEFEAGFNKTGYGRCHMDYCSFFSIQAAVPLGVLSDGTLFAVSSLGWGANYKVPKEGDTRDEYSYPPVSVTPKKPFLHFVFCSKKRPYNFDFYDGRWTATALRPGDDAAISGADETAYSAYWAACHHFFPRSAFDPLVHKLAPKLGYQFSGGFPQSAREDHITQPSDLIAGITSTLPSQASRVGKPPPVDAVYDTRSACLYGEREGEKTSNSERIRACDELGKLEAKALEAGYCWNQMGGDYKRCDAH